MDRDLSPPPIPISNARPHQSKRTIHLLLWLMIPFLLFLGLYQIWEAWNEVTFHGMDLQQDFIAAQRLRAGQNIYTPFSRAEVAALGVQEHLGVGMRFNNHPPINALLMMPLTLLPFRTMALCWTIGCVVVLLIAVRTIINELNLPIVGLWQAVMLLFLPNWYPVWLHLHLGQFTILLFGLVVGTWYCLRRGHDRWAGCLLAVATVVKIYPGFLLIYALLRGRWRVLQAAALTALVLVLLQSFIYPHQWLDYFTRTAPNDASEWVGHERNASLGNLSTRLFTGSEDVKPLFDLPGLELPFRALLYVLFLVLSGVAIWRYRHTTDLTGEFSLLLSIMLLITPLSWEHAFIFILLPLGYLWQQFRRHRRLWNPKPIYFALLSIGFSLFPSVVVMNKIMVHYLPDRMPSLVGLLSPGVFVFICCYVAVLLTLEQQRRTSSHQSGELHTTETGAAHATADTSM